MARLTHYFLYFLKKETRISGKCDNLSIFAKIRHRLN